MRIMVVFDGDGNFFDVDTFIVKCRNRDELTDDRLKIMIGFYTENLPLADWIVRMKHYFLVDLSEDDFSIKEGKICRGNSL